MSDSFSIGKNTFTFSSVSGTVIADKRSSRTIVSGGKNVTSRVQEKQELWLRSDSGKDFSVTLDTIVPVLEGHTISVVSISDGKYRHRAYLCNHSSSRVFTLMSGSDFLAAYPYLTRFGCCSAQVLAVVIMMAFAVAAVIFWSTFLGLMAIIMPLATIYWFITFDTRRTARATGAYSNALKEFCAERGLL